MQAEGGYSVGPFLLDPARRRLAREGSPIEMTPTVFDALLYFLRNPQRPISKDELRAAVWPGRVVEESNLRQTVFTLRKALGAEGRDLIATVTGGGYQFTGSVRRVPPAASGESLRRRTPPRPGRRRILAMPGLWLAVAAVLAVTSSLFVWFHGTGSRVGTRHLVVMADFANQTHESIFDGSLQNLLRVDLGQSPFVNVMPDNQARATLKQMEKPADTLVTGAVAAEICERNNADAVVQGSIAAIGSAYLVSLTASGCATGAQLAAAERQVDRREAVVPALDALIVSLRRQLGESFASVRRYDVPLVPARTGSLDALKAYSEASWLFDHGKIAEAIPIAQHAVALDPELAAAHVLIGLAHINLGVLHPAKEELSAAFALRGRMNERDRDGLAGLYHEIVEGDMLAAIRDFQSQTELYPGYVKGWANLADAQNVVGQYAAAAITGRQALALNPMLQNAYVVTMRAERSLGRFAEAWKTSETALAQGLGGDGLHRERLAVAVARRDSAGIASEVAWSDAHPSEMILITRAELAMSQGRPAEAAVLYAAVGRLPGNQFGNATTAMQHAGELAEMGLNDAASALLANYTGDTNDPDYLDAESIVGDPSHVDAVLDRLLAANPRATLLTQIYIPQARAQLALRRGDPAGALRDLRVALAYQARGLRTLSLVGAAYLALGEGAKAAVAYRSILGHHGWRPESPLLPLAQFGLAHALSLTGDGAGSRAGLRAFIASWARADSELPALRVARSGSVDTMPVSAKLR